MRQLTASFICMSAAFASQYSLASQADDLCMSAAINAERKFSIPNNLLQAISIVETGHSRNDNKLMAWPWTVNTAGKGYYFNTRAAAESFVEKKSKAGVKSIDIGCYQINTKWHGNQFSSTSKMFTPTDSAEYAAKFLSNLYTEFGDWDSAVRNYHSRNKTLGIKYEKKIKPVLATLSNKKTNAQSKPAAAPQLRESRSLIFTEPSTGGVALIIFMESSSMFDDSQKSIIKMESR